MKKNRLFAQILAVALCLALLCPLTAFAEGETKTAIPADTGSYAVIDPAAMQKLVENYCNARKLNPDNISVGYCYPDTGDTWYYNGDNWYFGAGVYYVPLTMILAEWESSGKVTRDTSLQGFALGDAERYILVYSNNYCAHEMMRAIGSDKDVREKYKAYSPLPDEYYDPDFLDYSYFSARFLTDVMKTLYSDEERFPYILDCLKMSDAGEYFDGAMRGEYEVAQKYGNYIDRRKVEYNNCTGIIYTPHPFILTVMTENMGISSEIMWDMAVIFKDYTLGLDEAYDSWKNGGGQPQTETAVPTLPSIPTIPAPGQTETAPGETVEANQPGLPAAPADQEQTEPSAQDGQITATVEESPAEAPAKAEESSSVSGRLIVLILCAALVVILILGAVLRTILRRRGRH